MNLKHPKTKPCLGLDLIDPWSILVITVYPAYQTNHHKNSLVISHIVTVTQLGEKRSQRTGREGDRYGGWIRD